MTKYKKYKYKDYDKLDNRTKEKYVSFLKKVYDSGYTITELKRMDDLEFSQKVGIKKGKRISAKTESKLYEYVDNKDAYRYSNINSHRRILSQIQASKERKFETLDKTLDKYKKFGFRGKRLDETKAKLIKTVGGVFDTISKKVNREYFSNPKSKQYEADKDIAHRLANQYAKELLAISKDKRDQIEKAFDKNLFGQVDS